FEVHDGSVRSEEVVQYLEQLLRQMDGHVVVGGFSQVMVAAASGLIGPFAAPALLFAVGSALSLIGLSVGPETLRAGYLPAHGWTPVRSGRK
ncbi:MAG: hypothetical protein ACP5IF_07780, partial [Conexivisphaera sp.]